MTRLTRRTMLGALGATAITSPLQVAYADGAQDRKLVFIILRGALDGLAALIPDDKKLSDLRQATIPTTSERLQLHNGFSLHPSLTSLHQLYQDGEAGFVHAAATPYRDRSHFDGQDELETLGDVSTRDGWLNRAVRVLAGSGLAVGYSLPLALRGDGAASNWSPPVFADASDDLLDRLQDLYAAQPVLLEPLTMARATSIEDVSMGRTRPGAANQYSAASKALGQLMRAENGPNIGMLSFDGWDTHANQAGPFAARLRGLDAALLDLKSELGSDWTKTTVIACSEFGRTAAENGSRGTDHGTGGLMILAGGAVRGGQVFGDWPGLKPRHLYEGRDLAPANDITATLKGVLRDHLGVSSAVLNAEVFPGTSQFMSGLVRA